MATPETHDIKLRVPMEMFDWLQKDAARHGCSVPARVRFFVIQGMLQDGQGPYADEGGDDRQAGTQDSESPLAPDPQREEGEAHSLT